MMATNAQELFYGEGFDYLAGSPHLYHSWLHERLASIVRQEVIRWRREGTEPAILEVGAGHGSFTAHLLALGARVTAVDMSAPSIAELRRRYGVNEKFRAFHSADGTLATVENDQYNILLCISVLHHIPDYLGYIETALQHLRVGGTFISLQDPLWYGRVARWTRLLNATGYFAWRATRGSLAAGLRTRGRRIAGILDPTNPADMVEYHVVRDGVDEQALEALSGKWFSTVESVRYWSNQNATVQRCGDRLNLENTFGIVAKGLRSRSVGEPKAD